MLLEQIKLGVNFRFSLCIITVNLLRILVKYSSLIPDDGSHTIRNMSEWFLILCLLKFLYNVDCNVKVLYNQVHLVG